MIINKKNIPVSLLIPLRIYFILLFLLFSFIVHAQYFGRNKPGYKVFDFNVFETPHFEIYHYLENDTVINKLAQQCEQWYKMHRTIFPDTFINRNPIIIYTNHGDFQQTTAVSSMIGVGTGGVTEYLKNRVVMPVLESNHQTDHVIGHELVHAFQYNLIRAADSVSMVYLRNLPLWMVEGMAEYMSIGSVDAHTSMWMRDALLNNDFPTLEQMTKSSEYFPYRYGQAFWAFVTKVWGDTIIIPLFTETAKIGFENAVIKVFGFNSSSLSNMWKNSMNVHFGEYLKGRSDNVAGDKIEFDFQDIDQSAGAMAGNKLIFEKNAGDINVSPCLSPDGEYIVFYSEKDIFTLDLFLASTKTGKILKKLSSTARDLDIDAYSFIESAGTWSPDSKKFAFTVYRKGINNLVIIDISKGKIIDQIEIGGIPAFSNPSWSPDGEKIVVSGLVDGVNDLYLYYLETGEVAKLTNDFSAQIQPNWSPDGRYIVFSTDAKPEPHPETYFNNTYNIALLDILNNQIKVLDIFIGADNLNPVFSSDSKSVYFLSNSDGFRNLFNYSLETGKVNKLTRYITGISGITAYSPAITVSQNADKIAYSYFTKNTYKIYSANTDDFNPVEVDPGFINLDAATLPPLNRISVDIIDKNLITRDIPSVSPVDTFRAKPYFPRFKLDYIGNTGIGISANRFGTGMAGSIEMLFSDILGDNQIYTGFALNGEIYDFGGQISYFKQKGKINWGAGLSHMPWNYAMMSLVLDSIEYGDQYMIVQNMRYDNMRIFEDKVSIFAYLPISQTRRIEGGASLAHYGYRIDRYNTYYDLSGYYRLGMEIERNLPAPEGFGIKRFDVAYVEDNSSFGMASPFQGHRFRLQFEKYFGKMNLTSALFDYRKYLFINPVCLGFRVYHYGRYGTDSDQNILSPLYIGLPGMVRGYEWYSFYRNQGMDTEGLSVNQLLGSRMLIGNVELRLPFTGPKRLALIRSGIFFTELALFFDAGYVWDSQTFNKEIEHSIERIPVYSTGLSIRINLFGSMIIEPYYAFPLQRTDVKDGIWGINIVPGW